MKLSPAQIEIVTAKVLALWKEKKVALLRATEAEVLQSMRKALQKENDRLTELEKEVNKLLNDLEAQHAGQFERHKMLPLLRQKVAKERKVVL